MASDGDNSSSSGGSTEPPNSAGASNPAVAATLQQFPVALEPAAGAAGHNDKAGRYDKEAIRRGIAQAFTPGELSRFAQRFKVFTDREGSAARGAAQLVRALDARGELADLAEALRTERPDFAWPAPRQDDSAEPAASALVPADALDDPFAAPVALEPEVPIVKPVEETKPAPPPAAADALDGKRATLIAALVFGGGLALGIGATLVATLRGSSSGQEAPAPRRGPVALAMLAADELAVSVEYVSTTCEMDERKPKVREQLAEAFRRCAVTDIPPSHFSSPNALPAPSVPSAKSVRRPEPERSIPLRRPTPAASCLDKCHRIHGQCVSSECGPEPSSANQYPEYQRCSSRCMTRYSHCRLSCR